MRKKGKRRQRTVSGAGSSGGAGTIKFTAPTSGLEYFFFAWGTAKDAAKFMDTVSKLVRHVDTSLWPQSSVAPKAMSTLETPEVEEPAVPTRKYGPTPAIRSRPTTGQARRLEARSRTILQYWRTGHTTSRSRNIRWSKRSTTSKCWPGRRTRPSVTT